MTTQLYIDFDPKGATPLEVINSLETTLRALRIDGKLTSYLIAIPDPVTLAAVSMEYLALYEEETPK